MTKETFMTTSFKLFAPCALGIAVSALISSPAGWAETMGNGGHSDLAQQVQDLKAKVEQLEASKFAGNTQLFGLVTTYLADAYGSSADEANSPTLSYQAFLTLASSFTGSDSLLLALGAENVKPFSTGLTNPDGFGQTTTDEAMLLSSLGTSENDITLALARYSTPLNDKLTLVIDALLGDRSFSQPITSMSNFSTGAISYYGRTNPMFYPTFHTVSLALEWKPTEWLDIGFTRGSEVGGNDPSVGLTRSGHTTTIEPIVNLGRLRLGGSIQHASSPGFGVNTFSGSNAAKLFNVGPVESDTIVFGGFYQVSEKLDLGVSVGYLKAKALGVGTEGEAEVANYRVNVIFPNAGPNGSTAGLIIGTQPKLIDTSTAELAAAIGLTDGLRKDRDTGYHIESYYAHVMNPYLTVTPGFVWLTAPNHDARNPDVKLAVVRATFSF
jgi:hypothetical protein